MSEPVARTVTDFCRAYGISRRQMYRLIGQGKLEAVKVGTGTRILEESARAWLRSLPRTHGTTPGQDVAKPGTA